MKKDEFRIMNDENGIRSIIKIASPSIFILPNSSFILSSAIPPNSSSILSPRRSAQTILEYLVVLGFVVLMAAWAVVEIRRWREQQTAVIHEVTK